jgi:hypothetical protein
MRRTDEQSKDNESFNIFIVGAGLTGKTNLLNVYDDPSKFQINHIPSKLTKSIQNKLKLTVRKLD